MHSAATFCKAVNGNFSKNNFTATVLRATPLGEFPQESPRESVKVRKRLLSFPLVNAYLADSSRFLQSTEINPFLRDSLISCCRDKKRADSKKWGRLEPCPPTVSPLHIFRRTYSNPPHIHCALSTAFVTFVFKTPNFLVFFSGWAR